MIAHGHHFNFIRGDFLLGQKKAWIIDREPDSAKVCRIIGPITVIIYNGARSVQGRYITLREAKDVDCIDVGVVGIVLSHRGGIEEGRMIFVVLYQI